MAKKVLVIEDSPTDAIAIKELLINEGLEVDIATSGEKGLEKALSMKPDLIVLDLILPGISGFEVCSRLKKEVSLRNTIVVVLSVKDNIDDINKAFHVDADDYIIKPAEPEFLTRKIKLYLGIRSKAMAKKVLVIEDSPTDAAVIKELLINEGLEVDIATSGEKGLEKALSMKPDLIVLDLILPGISGFEVCSRLKKEVSLRNTIVVVLSAKDNIDDINKIFHVEADNYIVKSSDPTLLVEKIKSYLGMG